MESDIFVWDVARNELNRRKHGIAFEDAVRVFEDTWAVLTFDGGHSALEDRHILVGMVRGMWIAAVVFTERPGVTRIVSARPATAGERRTCDEQRR